MLIDSHHHLWRYSPEDYGWISDEMSILRRDFWSSDLQQVASDCGIEGFVSVQARQSLEETETLLDLAESESLVRGVVGWVEFASPEITDQLDRFSDHEKLKGLRHVVQDEPDDQFILGQDFNRGIRSLVGRNLVYDVLIFARQLGPSVEFVRRHADIAMVLDHIAKPTIGNSGVDKEWESQIREIAKSDNLACKFSGVATEVTRDTWDIDLIRPYWDVVLDAFSPSRLMFGSDWPVCLLRTEYKCWYETVVELASDLSAAEQNEIFGGTATRVYHLE